MKKTILTLLGILMPTAAHAMEFHIIPRSNGTADWDAIFRTGDFTWINIINFLLHIIQVLLAFASVLAVILIMYGGFQYIAGALTDDKDSGKKTIKFSIIGLVVTLSAWILVDLVVTFVTGNSTATNP